jgi:hypothetical protein
MRSDRLPNIGDFVVTLAQHSRAVRRGVVDCDLSRVHRIRCATGGPEDGGSVAVSLSLYIGFFVGFLEVRLN